MSGDLVFGIGLCLFGLITLAARIFGWERLISQRQAAKDRLGDRLGDAIHLLGYTIAPIAFGAILMRRGGGIF